MEGFIGYAACRLDAFERRGIIGHPNSKRDLYVFDNGHGLPQSDEDNFVFTFGECSNECAGSFADHFDVACKRTGRYDVQCVVERDGWNSEL